MDIYKFMGQLTKNIEYNLSELFIEKYLYNFIRDFLYSPTKLLYVSPYINGNLQSSIEIPITGSNYMILFDESRLEQKNINIFNEINSVMENSQEYIFEIWGILHLLNTHRQMLLNGQNMVLIHSQKLLIMGQIQN